MKIRCLTFSLSTFLFALPLFAGSPKRQVSDTENLGFEMVEVCAEGFDPEAVRCRIRRALFIVSEKTTTIPYPQAIVLCDHGFRLLEDRSSSFITLLDCFVLHHLPMVVLPREIPHYTSSYAAIRSTSSLEARELFIMEILDTLYGRLEQIERAIATLDGF